MNINGTIDKTFFNSELHSVKKPNTKNIRADLQDQENNENFYSKFLLKIKEDDQSKKSGSKPRKSGQFDCNIINIQGYKQGRDGGCSPRPNDQKCVNTAVLTSEQAAMTSNLNPRKLKKENNPGSNMILAIPGHHPNKKNSSNCANTRKRKSMNVSNIDIKDIRQTSNEENDNEVCMSNRSNMSNVLKIMIPQSDKLRELGEEESKKLEVQKNIIEIEVIGSKEPNRFLFDTLQIQKLDSIKELSSKKPEDFKKSIVILNQLKGNKINPEQRINPNENQIIIINQNDFKRFPSDQPVKHKAKSKMFCCIPVK